MSVPSRVPPGRHEVRVTWSDKGRTVPAKVFTFDVVNPHYGRALADPDVEALKKKYRNRTVVCLQDGAPCEDLKLKSYSGCADAKIHATHRVGDRNADWVNFGGTDVLEVGHYGQELRILLRFDLSAVPRRARVELALLKLYMHAAPSRGGGKGCPQGKYAYRVLRPWGEGVGNGSIFDAKDGKIRDGECSWKAARHPETWGVPGCGEAGVDRGAGPLSASSCDGQTADAKGRLPKVKKVWVKWDLTSAARDWVKGPGKNFGVLLAVGEGKPANWNESQSRTACFFRSSEYFDPPFRPKLILVYRK